MKKIVLCLLPYILGSGAAAEEFDLPRPATTPAASPFVPEGEKSFYPADIRGCPGTRIWVQWLHKADIWHYGTTQSVGDGAGMYVWLPAKGKTGFLCSEDTGVIRRKEAGKVIRDDYVDYKGISLWIKGDGSDGHAIITTGFFGSKHRYRIPLRETTWHKVFIAWDDFQPEPIKGPVWFITYGLERTDDAKDNWYIIDRIHYFRERKVEPVTPTRDADPPGMIPARAFVSGRARIARTLAKLEAKKPVKIVVAGDSLVTGAQLGYARRSYTADAENTNRKYYFFALLGERLKTHYDYESLAVIHCEYQGKTGPWKDWPDPRPGGDLVVMSVARGGWEARQGLEQIEQILGEKPDCVIWEYGVNEMLCGHLESYADSTEAAVDKLKAAGIEVVLQTVTPTADLRPKPWLKGKTFAEYGGLISAQTRRIAEEKGCAVADHYRAQLSRGQQFMGDITADFVHLNHLGHEMFADLLDALFTDRDVRIWKHGPAALETDK